MAGIFSLSDARRNKLKDISSEKINNIPEYINYGYFGGGYTPLNTAFSIIDRVDFSTDTISVPTSVLSETKRGVAGVSNSSYGYIGGGEIYPVSLFGKVCTIDRLDFATETVTEPTGYYLTQARRGSTSFSSNVYGYFVGGAGGPGSPISSCSIDRINFSTETTSLSPVSLPEARFYLSSVSNSSYGYIGGGRLLPTSTFLCTIDRLDLIIETISSPAVSPGQLRSARGGAIGSSSQLYGYFCGGAFPTQVNTIDRLDFSTEVTSSPSPLITSGGSGASVSDKTYGYIAGFGFNPTVCTINRIDFNTETITSPSSQLSKSKSQFAGITERPVIKTLFQNDFANFPGSDAYGYFGGGSNNTGYPPGWQNTIDRLDFSNDTTSEPGKNLLSRRSASAVSNNFYGYFGGGGAEFTGSMVDRLEYSNDSVNRLSISLRGSGDSSDGKISSNNYGYFTGGTLLDRIDFSNETVSAPGKNLSQTRTNLFSNQSNLYGYFSGGTIFSPPTIYTTIERLEFSTETLQIPGNNLTLGVRRGVDFSSDSYGYMAFYSLPIPSPIDYKFTNKLDFSTETIESPATIISANSSAGGVSSNSAGYSAGGMPAPGSFPAYSGIRRINFSTDTVSISPSRLSKARFNVAAVSGGQSQRVLVGRTTGTYGYFAGGSTPTSTCTINRLDFSTETITTPAPQLTEARRSLAAVLSNSYGYFGGGFTTVSVNTVDRIDFSTETTSAPGKNLTQARYGLAAVYNASYGYFGGGFAPPIVCTIDRLDFYVETVSDNSSTRLRNSRFNLAATPSNSYGYFGGGSVIGGATANNYIDRLDFSSETTSSPGNNLSQERVELCAVSNNFYGYFVGGQLPGTGRYSTIDRIDFLTDTRSLPGKNLPQEISQSAATSSSSYAYFGGGVNDSSLSICTIDRIDFFTETISAPGKNFSENRFNLTAVSTEQRASTGQKGFSSFSATYGYWVGGVPTPGTCCIIDRIDFNNDTMSLPGKNLPYARYKQLSGENGSYAYFGGGYGPGFGASCTINRLDFSNETTTFPGKYFSTTRINSATSDSYIYAVSQGSINCSVERIDFSNENVSTLPLLFARTGPQASSTGNKFYGYFFGGLASPGGISTIKRLDFSTETSNLPGYSLQVGGGYFGVVASESYGYITGGTAPPLISVIQRLDFSNETTKILGKAPSHLDVDYVCGLRSASHGYFGGGNSRNTVSRLEFITETISLPGNNLSLAVRGQTGSTTNIYKPPIRNGWGWRKTYGYFVGGGISPQAPAINSFCIIERLDFSNETLSILNNINSILPVARYNLSSVSNNSYGYFGGGSTLGSSSGINTIDRLDFSNETTSAPGNNLTKINRGAGTVSSSSYGYFAAGNLVSTSNYCAIDRLDFSTELVSAPGISITEARSELSGVFNVSYGYFGGGETPSRVCTIDRLDFSNETIFTPAFPAQLATAKTQLASVSSSSYGYFGGGIDTSPPPSQVCIIERIDFSTETTSAPGKNLSQARVNLAAVSSGSYGYFGFGLSTPFYLTTVDRLDFSTETTGLISGNLSRNNIEATGIQAN